VHALGHLAQKCRGNGFVGGVLVEVDGNEKLFSLLVNIANVDTTLVSEEDPVTLKRKGQPPDGDV
jgi:hypothetical protein